METKFISMLDRKNLENSIKSVLTKDTFLIIKENSIYENTPDVKVDGLDDSVMRICFFTNSGFEKEIVYNICDDTISVLFEIIANFFKTENANNPFVRISYNLPLDTEEINT